MTRYPSRATTLLVSTFSVLALAVGLISPAVAFATPSVNHNIASVSTPAADPVDGETPEIVAEKVYGNAEYHWIIMLANDIYDSDLTSH